MAMFTVRTRDNYKYFKLVHGKRDLVLSWKKGKSEFPQELYEQLVKVVERYFCGFDILTVPAPSFHDYSDNYPIWEIAKKVAKDTGMEAKVLFPEKSGKTRKHYTGWRQKKVQDIKLGPGLFVLVIDDIVTTGNTMGITFEAILRKGSYPCGLVIT